MGDLDLTPGQPKGSETILSEEMWEKVLMNLTVPSDVLNAGKTCIQFQRILHLKMVEANLTNTLPFLTDYMDCNSVLNCRLVSKGWMGVVDNFFENHVLEGTLLESHELKPITCADEGICALYLFGTNYDNSSDHERFMREMKDHPRNPFIGRAVNIFGLVAAADGGEEFRTFYKFFEMFGKHIWTLELEMMTRGSISEVQREQIFPFIIRDVFELAPNLKTLCIKDVPIPITVSMSKNEICALAPPSALEKLEISQAFSVYDDEEIEEIENAILLRHSNSQLKVLHTKTLDRLRNLNWPNLRELHFTNIERMNDLDVMLRNLRMPNLELLSIGLRNEFAYYKNWWQSGQRKAFMKFLRGLHHLCASSPNLKSLRFISTGFWDKDSNQPMGFPNPRGVPCLENIKTLQIPEETIYHAPGKRNFHVTTDYSFLLRFPHIENVHVYKDPDSLSLRMSYERGRYPSGAAFDKEIVEVHKFMDSRRMYESNIWKLLPKLNVFSYGKRIYTRSSYERRCLPK